MMTSLQKRKIEQETYYKDWGFTINPNIGIGDTLQFSSLPENFFHATGFKLIDVNSSWCFDHNPYVIRNSNPKKTIELWNYPSQYAWPTTRNNIYCSNAEIHLKVFGLKDPILIRPRLYEYENFKFEKREMILFHPFGRSHGSLPNEVIDHVIQKYQPTGNLFQIGLPDDPSLGLRRIETHTLWDLAKVISQCRMFIGIDSGPSWIAACYPDVIVKKVRTKFQFGTFSPQEWIPLERDNPHSFWDDRCFQIYNTTEKDMSFTLSYLKL